MVKLKFGILVSSHVKKIRCQFEPQLFIYRLQLQIFIFPRFGARLIYVRHSSDLCFPAGVTFQTFLFNLGKTKASS